MTAVELPPLVRSFVALEINAEVRSALAQIQNELKKTGAHVSWVPAVNIHLSLAFLGDVPRAMIGSVAQALCEAGCGTPAFSFTVAGVGSFGSRRSPRVIWAGVRPEPLLIELHARVVTFLRRVGMTLERREFHPHLTLGRVRSSRGRAELSRALETVQLLDAGTVQATRAVLMQSVLQSTGARYSVLHEAPLRPS